MMCHTRTRDYIFFVITILLLTLSACASFNKDFESPTVNIVDIKVKELKLLEAVFNIQLRVINPNDLTVVAKGISCDLEINGNHLAKGVSNKATEIPAFGTAIIPVELYSSALDVVKNVIALSDQKNLNYRIKGRLNLEGDSFMLPYFSFESEGAFDIK